MKKEGSFSSTSQPLPQNNQDSVQPSFGSRSNKLLKACLYLMSAIVLIAVGSFGHNCLRKEREKNKSATPLIELTTTELPNQTPVTDPYEGWKDYKHPTLGYGFIYPPNATLSAIGDPNESDCISVKLGLAYLSIKSPTGAYGGCLVTGEGAYDEVKNIEESVPMLGQNAIFSGKLIDSSKDPDAKKELTEFLRLTRSFMSDREVTIEYGGSYSQSEMSSYLSDKEKIKEIISLFRLEPTENLTEGEN